MKHSRFSSKAILLHSANFKETSLIGTFFTDTYGLIKLVVKGAKAKKSRFSNIKVPGAVFEIEFGGRGELKNLYTSEIIDSVVIDESNLKIHLYLHEIIIRTLELEAPVKPIFESLLTILKEIEKISDASQKEIKLRQFEFQLISELGYEFSLLNDCNGKMIKKDSFYEFIPNQGLKEIKETSEISRLNVSKGSSILKFSEGAFENDQSKKFIKYIMRSSLDTISAKPLNSSKFFRLKKDAN